MGSSSRCKESVDVKLLLLHMFLTFFKSVALALDIDNGAMVEDAIKDGRCDGDVGEHLVPLREGFV